LIIVCGLPCSGKTAHAKELERSLKAIRLCPDEWMDALEMNLWDERSRAKIEALQWRLGQHLLSIGQTIIIEWGTWGRSERDALREGAKALGAAVELHYLAAPTELLFERAKNRGMEDPPITLEHFRKWAKAFEAPTSDEAQLYDDSEGVC
jgi:predicted kinase